jgi:hypothetical protein
MTDAPCPIVPARSCLFWTESHGCCDGRNEAKPKCHGAGCENYEPDPTLAPDAFEALLAECGYCEARR